MNLAESYAAITREVAALIERHAENDSERAGYMVARAALLAIRERKGAIAAAAKAYALADELSVLGDH